jgi:hypothetical protein
VQAQGIIPGMIRVTCVLVVALLLAVAGCCPTFSFGGKSGPSGGPTTAPPTAGASSPATTGHVSGTIFGTDGKPLAYKGAKVHVGVGGVSAVGANVSFSPAVEDGRYDLEPAKGLYQVRANMELDWNGKHYRLDLEPVQDNTVSRDSAKGFVQDFNWRIRGPNRRAADPANHTHWWGVTVSMVFSFYREDLKKGVPKPPEGSKAIFTFTPKGPLMDGSQGQPVVFERPFDKLLTGLTNNYCCDLPLGDYKVTGVIQLPDGKTVPARIQTEYAKFADSLDCPLEPDQYGKPFVRIVGFTWDGQ